MGEEEPSPHLANRIMGMIADRLSAQLAEMKARHAESDRRTQEHLQEARRLRKAIEAMHAREAAEDALWASEGL